MTGTHRAPEPDDEVTEEALRALTDDELIRVAWQVLLNAGRQHHVPDPLED